MKNDYSSDPFRHWYLPMILGLIFVGLGIWVLVTPAEFFITLSLLFAFSFMMTGILEVIHALASRHDTPNWGWLIGGGVIDLMIGILLVSRPQISMIILPFFIGFGIMFRSIMSIGWSIELKKLGEENWAWLLSVGTISLLLSFVLLWNPAFAGLTIALYAGISFIIIGVSQTFLSLRLRRINKKRKPLIFEIVTSGEVEFIIL